MILKIVKFRFFYIRYRIRVELEELAREREQREARRSHQNAHPYFIRIMQQRTEQLTQVREQNSQHSTGQRTEQLTQIREQNSKNRRPENLTKVREQNSQHSTG